MQYKVLHRFPKSYDVLLDFTGINKERRVGVLFIVIHKVRDFVSKRNICHVFGLSSGKRHCL